MRLRLLALISCAVLIGACGDSDDSNDTDTGNGGGETDTGGGGGETDTGNGGGGGETDTGGGGETDTGLTPEEWEALYFHQCDVDDDCPLEAGETQICVRHVCVIPPSDPATLVDEEDHDNVIRHPEMTPNTECYEDIFEVRGEDRNVRLVGMVERFGSGPTTSNLCVTIYDEATLLPWLINSECHQIAVGEGELDDDARNQYVGCFALDPCRCEEYFDGEAVEQNEPMIRGAEAAMRAAGTPMQINDVDSCYSFIGYCSGITDAGKKAACQARVAANGENPGQESLVFGSTRTVASSLDTAREEPEGRSLYTFDNVPTNWRFAVKASGRENRWRDTWQYGQFTRGDLIRNNWPWYTADHADPETRHKKEIYWADLGLSQTDEVLRVDGTAVGAGTWATIPPAVGIAGGIDDTHGAVAGVIRDCGADDRNPWAVVNARVGISFSQGSTLSYFNGNFQDRLPNPAMWATNIDGTYAAIDLPPGPNRIAPVICLNDCSSRDDYVFAGAKNVFQTPKSVIIATFQGYFTH